MPLRTHAVVLGVSLSWLTGCTGVETGATTGALTGSVGVLHVDRAQSDLAASTPVERTELRAAFARYRGIESDAVLRLLGSGESAELGRCEIVSTEELGAEDADVELLDVGELGVDVAGTETRLVPRTFPDLASVLAGVFYAGDATLAVPEPEVDVYRFHAEGSTEVGAFDVLVPAPAAPADVALAGADGEGIGLDGALIEVPAASALAVRWDAGVARDFVEIEVVSAGQTLACVGRDEGAFRIDGRDLAQLSPDADARLSMRRVRVSPFDAPGMDDAFVRLAASRTFAIAIR